MFWSPWRRWRCPIPTALSRRPPSVAAGSVLVGAEAPVAPEVPAVATQEITPHGLSTDEQIDRWIAQRAEAGAAYADDDAGPWLERDDRKMHGEVTCGDRHRRFQRLFGFGVPADR